jgi:predicted glutamine amidotransferase
MCRFTLYLGPPVRLASLLTEPSHSLIRQSYEASERSEPLNGDGFGVGWYAPRLTPEPAVFHAITPAWNNGNLQSIAKVVTSPCILAHVRAASPGSDVNLANCHPFSFGRHLLMHNGNIGSFRRIRRRLLESLGDEAYHLVRGSTDTEHLFAVFIDELGRDAGADTENEPDGGVGARRLGAALARALSKITAFIEAEGGGEPSFLNVAVTDGSRAAVARFTDHSTEKPESLYILADELYEPAGRQFHPSRVGDEGPSVVVSSERLTDDERWSPVPANTLLMVDRWTAPVLVPLGRDGSWADAPLADAHR